MPVTVLADAVDAVLINPAIGRFLAQSLAADPAALLVGAPPVVGKLVGELRGRGADLPVTALAEAVDAALTNPAVTRQLAATLTEASSMLSAPSRVTC